MNEFDLIRRYFDFNRGAKNTNDIVVGIGDDAAVVHTMQEKNLVITTDTLVEGVHFFSDMDAARLAKKSLVVSLSDLAAMAARPRWMTIALTAPALPEAWFAAFARGCADNAKTYDYAIIGGDLTRGDKIVITTTAIGACEHKPLTRAAAQANDDIWLSASIGEAAYAVDLIKNKQTPDAALMQQLEQPTPRLQLGQELATLAHAAIDLSDGALLSCNIIAQQSNVQCVLWADKIPTPATCRALPRDEFLQHALCGGDDYELLWTAPPQHRDHIQNNLCTRPHRIGSVQVANNENHQTLVYESSDSNSKIIKLNANGYEHQF